MMYINHMKTNRMKVATLTDITPPSSALLKVKRRMRSVTMQMTAVME